MKFYMRLLQSVVSIDFLRLSLSTIGVITAVTALFFYKLGSLLGGVDDAEFAIQQRIMHDNLTLIGVIRDAINLPYNIGLYLMQFWPFHGAGSLRLVSVAFGFACVLSLYLVVKRWHTHKIALLTTAMFVTSSWTLHVFRYASPVVLFTLPIILLGCWLWLHKTARKRYILPLLCIAAAGCAYVPGLLIPLVVLMLWQYRRIRRIAANVEFPALVAIILVSVLALVPLAAAVIAPPQGQTLASVVGNIVGLPHGIPTMSEILVNGRDVLGLLTLGSPTYTPLTITGVALLDLFTIAMATVGFVIYIRDWRLERSFFVLAMIAYAGILAVLSGAEFLILALPFIYLLVADGISYVLSEWLAVFPRNPIARSVGISIVIVAVFVSALYNLTSYYVAWPHTNEAKTHFKHRL